jgi:hypothetical protein
VSRRDVLTLHWLRRRCLCDCLYACHLDAAHNLVITSACGYPAGSTLGAYALPWGDRCATARVRVLVLMACWRTVCAESLVPGAHSAGGPDAEPLMCDICMDEKPASDFYALACGG